MTEEDFLERVAWTIYIILGIFGLLVITYTCTHTDVDCWFAQDPIVCQKVKESSK